MKLGRLAARVLIGGLFVGHGTQKLGGWFGGSGLDGTTGMMQALNLNPPRRNAVAAGATETAGGALLIAGLATPVASAALIGTMVTAIRTVHASNGPWVSNGGWEYNAVLIAVLTTLAEEGPGSLSLDGAFGQDRRRTGVGLAALALGVAASVATVEIGRRTPADAEPATGSAAEATPDATA